MRGDNIRNYKYTTLVAKRQVIHCSPYSLRQENESWAQNEEGSIMLGFRENFLLVDELTHQNKFPQWTPSGVDYIH